MFEVEIPGWGQLSAKYLVLDLNGTLSTDGHLIEGVKERLKRLSQIFDTIYVLTADTQSTAEALFQNEPVKLYKLTSDNGAQEKGLFVEKLGADGCIAIGNGANDALMLRKCLLGIGVLGAEGLATSALLNADIIVNSINDALELFLKPKRLIATLRR